MRSSFAWLLIIPFAVWSSAHAAGDPHNHYTESYVSKQALSVPLQPDPAGPKLYRGENKKEDYRRLLRKGYEQLGQSSFEAADVSPQQALEQARKIGADLVLVYSRQIGNVPLSVQLEQLREQAKNSEGHTTLEVEAPEQQNRYAYFATYWVKLAPPLIGVHVTSPGKDQEARGLKVLTVIDESPAAQARIQEGDAITRIGDVEISSPQALTQAAQRYAGETVEVALVRGGMESKTSMTLNPARK